MPTNFVSSLEGQPGGWPFLHLLGAWFQRCGSIRGEPATLQAKRDLDQKDKGGHLDEWADDGGKGGAGVESEDGYGDSNGELEVVAGGREGKSGRFWSSRRRFCGHQKLTKNMMTK
jgi:hypothetical protein